MQTSAVNMDPRKLKEKYGDKIVFWGGGVDAQRALPFGTLEQVKKEVMNDLNVRSGRRFRLQYDT
ncbi:hypothetical protein J7L27_00445 [Candidatus Bathyarchaeota archaeon]|nr:hypothetical protein [Candidatus Bathyarchaeota archaeon]